MYKCMIKDLKNWAPGILAAAAFVLVMQLKFGGVCPVRIFTGFPCPGCGLTRAALLLLKGDVVGSFQMHPMLLFIIVGIFLFLYEYYMQERGRGWFRTYAIVVILLFVVVYMIRMKLYFPDQAPMTYETPGLLLYLNFKI